jgi:hypothetical protein
VVAVAVELAQFRAVGTLRAEVTPNAIVGNGMQVDDWILWSRRVHPMSKVSLELGFRLAPSV